MPDRLLSIGEVAKGSGLPESTLHRYAADGLIPESLGKGQGGGYAPEAVEEAVAARFLIENESWTPEQVREARRVGREALAKGIEFNDFLAFLLVKNQIVFVYVFRWVCLVAKHRAGVALEKPWRLNFAVDVGSGYISFRAEKAAKQVTRKGSKVEESQPEDSIILDWRKFAQALIRSWK